MAMGVLLVEEFLSPPHPQDDSAGLAGPLPKLGLPGFGDSHCGGE